MKYLKPNFLFISLIITLILSTSLINISVGAVLINPYSIPLDEDLWTEDKDFIDGTKGYWLSRPQWAALTLASQSDEHKVVTIPDNHSVSVALLDFWGIGIPQRTGFWITFSNNTIYDITKGRNLSWWMNFSFYEDMTPPYDEVYPLELVQVQLEDVYGGILVRPLYIWISVYYNLWININVSIDNFCDISKQHNTYPSFNFSAVQNISWYFRWEENTSLVEYVRSVTMLFDHLHFKCWDLSDPCAGLCNQWIFWYWFLIILSIILAAVGSFFGVQYFRIRNNKLKAMVI